MGVSRGRPPLDFQNGRSYPFFMTDAQPEPEDQMESRGRRFSDKAEWVVDKYLDVKGAILLVAIGVVATALVVVVIAQAF